MRKLRAAILGFGGMGHCHAGCYKNLKNVELVAVCDIDPDQLKSVSTNINLGSVGGGDISKLRTYASYEKLLKAEKGTVDIIDCCLPAYLHAKYVCRAMKDGFAVLSEKPMALSTKDCKAIIATQKKTKKPYMVAQCIRFCSEYEAVLTLAKKKTYGRLLKMEMCRTSAYPNWDLKNGWYLDHNKSGGAVLDLHLHDLDWVQSAFGVPESLSCHGVKGWSGGYDDVRTILRYGKTGPIVSMHGSWMSGQGFKAGFSAMFEKAVLTFQDFKLVLTDLYGKEKPFTYKRTKFDMYSNEIEYFADCVRKGTEPERCRPESTAWSVSLVEAERRSAAAGGKPIAKKDLRKAK